MEQVEIPNKLFFRIGEVCKLLRLEPYVLRFWETEFPTLAPAKGANGRRMYRKKDVEMVLIIKALLYDRGFTIAGAKKVIAGRKHDLELASTRPEKSTSQHAPKSQAASANPARREKLNQVKTELRSILTLLNRRC